MKFYSFIRDGFVLSPVEIQVSLLPGLPEVKFSGLVDTAIKESATRLKSAFRKLGFKWPNKQQIIINLSPAHIKKTSLGMDLALASAILWKTGQIDFSAYQKSKVYAYGEITLDGEVRAPEDWSTLPLNKDDTLITGVFEGQNYRENNYLVKTLQDLDKGFLLPVEDWKDQLKVPSIPDMCFSSGAGLLLKIAAMGEHNLLLCGESGSGKTTIAENLYYLLSPPRKKIWEESKSFFKGEVSSWRPYINPHHTTTALSMIGGGAPLFPGEISKAHGGMLVLDEYLEFHSKVQEALREPVEKGQIRLVRRGDCAVFPAQFHLIATSNLCPCGDYIPEKNTQCAYSLRRCQSHLDRLSGPMLDRFDILAFSNQWKGEREVSLKNLSMEIQEAHEFRLVKRGQKTLNGHLDLKEMEDMLEKKTFNNLPETSSHRRKRALLRVARSFSDFQKEEPISSASLEKAFSLTVKNFYFLKNRMLMN